MNSINTMSQITATKQAVKGRDSRGRKVDYGENIKPSDDKVILTEYIIPAINPSHIAALSHTNSSDYN